jgi:hypothetical protein
MTDRRKRLLGGFLSSGAGLLTAAMIYLRPENSRVACRCVHGGTARPGRMGRVRSGCTRMLGSRSILQHRWLTGVCANVTAGNNHRASRKCLISMSSRSVQTTMV